MNVVELYQKALTEQLKRLRDNEIMEYNSKEEIQRANAIGKTCSEYAKICNLKFQVWKQENTTANRRKLEKYLGLTSDSHEEE